MQNIRTLNAVLVDPVTGTILGNEVLAIPGDVWNENAQGLDSASDSEIGNFATRYGVPLYVDC